MSQVEHIGGDFRHFEVPPQRSWPATISSLGRAAYSVLRVPEHDSSHFHDVAEELRGEPQPLQLPIEEEVAALYEGPAQLVDTQNQPPRLDGRRLLSNFAVLMQFTSFLSDDYPDCRTPFTHIDALHKELTEQGYGNPLSFSEQLTVALGQTSGDLPEALWRLFVTSRHHARWFDEEIITGQPDFSSEERKDRMLSFSRSVAACRPQTAETLDQDASGDTYYAWTHALGKVVFTSLAERETMIAKAGGFVMHNGTRLLQNIAFRFSAQTLPSNHMIAASYGNAIGEACTTILQTPSSGETRTGTDSQVA